MRPKVRLAGIKLKQESRVLTDERQLSRPLLDLTTTRVRSVCISDAHLRTRGCQAELLMSFLRCHEADSFYLIGDMVDGWSLKRNWYWPQLHNDVVQKILRKARKGARVVYLPANHDEFLRDYLGTHFGGI